MSFVRSFSFGFLASFASNFALTNCRNESCASEEPSSKLESSAHGSPLFDNVPWVKTWGIPWVEDWDNPGSRGVKPHTQRTDSSGKNRYYKRQLILIRHGQYENEHSRDETIRRLTPMGIQQSKLTGVYLRSLLKESNVIVGRQPKNIFVSDLTRAQETANLIVKELSAGFNLKVTTDGLLREKFPCDPQPPFSKKAREKDMRLSEEAYMKYFHRPVSAEDSTEIIVGHSNMIRYFVCRALQIPPEAWLRFSLSHCSLTVITIPENGHVKVSCVGDVGHLPPMMHSTNNLP